MLFKKESRRRRRGAGPLRLIMSLVMFSVLAFGIYSAYKSFSGVDPLKISPKSTLNSILSSDKVYEFLTKALSFSPGSIATIVSKNPVVADNPSHKVYPAQKADSVSIPTPKPTPKPDLAFRFAVVADSHNDNDDLKKALTQSKEAGAKFIIGDGDWSDVGTVDELRNAKTQFDAIGLPYYVIPGDHDLWDSRNRNVPPLTDFLQVFKEPYTSFDYDNDHFLLVDNSDNYSGVDPAQMNFIQNDLTVANQKNSKLILVFVHSPLYHPSSDHFMGKVEPKLKDQADFLINYFQNHRVSEVIAGDTHFYSRYTEPTHNLNMTAVGAITAYRNIQAPRFVMVDVYSDGSYNIQDTEVKQ